MTGTSSSASEADWRRLGLADLHLRIARTVFDSPGAAQPWVGAITRYAPNVDSLRAVLSAGLDPDEFIAWRAAGVDSWNIISWSEALSQVGLTHNHVKQWRSGGHKASTLPLLVPYLSKNTTFDEILEAVQDWNAQDLIGALEAGLTIADVNELRRGCVSGLALEDWTSSGVPAAVWKEWIANDIPVEAAAQLYPTGVDAATASEWLGLGLSAVTAAVLIEAKVPTDTVRQWIEGGFSPSDAAAFISAAMSPAEACQWTASGMTVSDAVTFVRGGITVATASEWLEKTELPAGEVVAFIQKDVSLQQAMEFERRGIGSRQVSRTDTGLQLDLYPWQEDPADGLPKVIESGAVNITLWTTAHGGDPVAHDVCFRWDGAHTADWIEDISIVNGGLSPASSSPVRGVLGWPDGEDVVLTYTWSDLGLEGHARLAGLAPTNGGSAGDPAQWVRLADALVEFVLLDLGAADGERRVEYLDAGGDCVVDIHEVLRDYLCSNEATSEADFGSWLEIQLTAGHYRIFGDED